MNRIYKVIFNTSLGLYQVVSEIARNHGKSSSGAKTGRKSVMVPFIVAALLALPVGAGALAADTETFPNTQTNTVVTVKAGDQLQGKGAAVVSSTTTKGETSDTTTTTITINVPNDGKVEPGNTGLVTGGTVYSEVRPATDGTYVKTSQTTAQNLTNLDTQVGTNTGAITNLKNLSNLTDAGQKVIQTASQNAVKVAAGTNIKVDSSTADDGSKTYTVSAEAIGKVAKGDTGLVSGDTVNTAITNAVSSASTAADTKILKKADVDAGNIGKNLKNADGSAAATSEEVTVNEKAWGTAIGTGSIAAPSGMLITDTAVHDELRPAADGTYVKAAQTTSQNLTALDTQVGTNTSDITKLKDLSNISDAGNTVIKQQAKQAVKVAADGNATVTTAESENDGSILTYTINVAHDGEIKDGDTKLVSGGTLYTELRPDDGTYVKKANTTAANLSALDTNLKNVITAVGLDVDDTTKSYTSKLNKYFKVNPTGTTAADAEANGTNSVAIGPNAKTSKYSTITTSGDTTTTTETAADQAVAIGDGAAVNAAGDKGLAIGNGASVGEAESTTTSGTTTTTTDAKGGESSAAIGDSAKANGNTSVALGANAQVLNTTASVVTGSTAIGSGAKVDGGSDSTALGTGATVDTASNAMAFGKGATINKTATSGVAIGNGAVTGSEDTTKTVDNVTYNIKAAGGVDSVAIGTSASSAGNTSIALGRGAAIENDTDGNYQAVVKSDDVAIGTGAKTSASDSSTAIGKEAKVSQSTDALAVGSGAQVSISNNAMAFGKGANAGSAADSIAMGTSAKTISADTIAIGQSTSAKGANSVVIGKTATTTDEGGNAIGYGSAASGYSTAIGQSAKANNYNAVAIGNNATANADRSISLGYNAGVGTSEGKGETQNAGSLIAIGTSSGNKVSGMQNVAIGEGAGSNVKSSYNIAIGTQAGYGINYASDDKTQNGFNVSVGYKANYQENSANIMYSTALGNEANASNYSVAVGNRAKAGGAHTVAIGEDAQATDASSIALGQNASAADGNIAIGNGSSAPAVSTLGTVKAVTVDGTTVNYVYDANGNQFKSAFTYKPLQADSHYISVGNSTLTRRISNVADGVFDSDAATVGQLNSLNELLQATDTKVGLTKDYFEEKFTNLNTTLDSKKTKYFSVSTSSDDLTANADNTGAVTGKADAMAIGPNANATNVKSLAVGNNVYATGLRSIAIGTAPNPTTDSAGTTTTHNTSADGENSIALGTSTTAKADNSIAIGTRAQTYTTDTTGNTGVSSVAIGNMATTAGNQSVALGYNATVKYNYGTAIGAEALASGTDAVAIGKGSKAYSTDSTAVGQDNSITGNNVYGLGSSNKMNGEREAITQSGVSGYKNIITSVSDQDTTNALTGIYMTGNSNTLNQNVKYNVMQDITVQGNSNTIDGGAGGTSSHQNTLSQISIVGFKNTVKGKSSGKSSDDGKTNNIKNVTILGYNNTVDANKDTTVDFSNTQILGNNVTAALGNSVYLGNNAAYVQPNGPAQKAIDAARTKADTAAEASDDYKAAATDEDKATIKAQYEAKYLYKLRVQAMEAKGTTAGMNSYDTDETYGNGTSYTYAGSNPAGVITVGSAGSERRIQNVAAGLVSATSTDAVNGSQLYALTRQIRFGGDNSSFGKTTAAEDQNVVARGSNETISITGGSDAVKSSTADGTTTYTVDAAKLTGNNIAVVADKDANALRVQLASNLKDLNTASMGKTTTGTAADGSTTTSYQETLKLDGTGDNGGTLELEDASGKNGVTLRTSGSTTTADVNGTATTRLLVNGKTVATTDDGLKFGGDTGSTSALKLNSKLTIKGGADTTKLIDNNIGVVSAGNGTLTVKLSKNVNLGMDGSLTTGTVTATAVTADTVTSGNSTLNTNGLTITNGPSVLATGINAGSKKITNVSDGEANADAANYGQVKAAKTTLSQGNNNVTITPNTASEDGHTNYTVSVSNLYYKAGTDTTAKDVALATGLTFNNGKNTTAVAGDNGTITYNLNDKIELGSETDSNNHIVVDGTKGLLTLGMNATINGNAGTASIGGVSIGKSGSDQVITGLTNKIWTVGTTQAVDGRAATENQLQSVADNLNTANTNIATLQHGFKVQANGDTTTESTVKADDALNFTAGDNAKVTTTKNSKQITISVDNLSVKDNNGTARSVKLADGLNFQDGTNTTAVVGANGSVTYDLKSSITLGTAADEANRIIVNGTNGTITVGNLATINGNVGTASIGGVSIGKSGSDQTVTGLSNTTWVVGTTTAVSGRAATEDQLKSVSDAADTNASNITTLQQGFTVTANNDNDKKSTIKAGDKLNFQAGKNVQISTTANSKSIEVALSDTPEFTTVSAKDASGNATTVSGTGVTIAPTGTGAQSVSLTSEGLDNGNHVIRNVASGGTVRTNAANIGDLQDAISNASTTTTNTGFNVKGDDTAAKKVKLGKQLNVVGGTTDSTQLSTVNIGVEATADAEGNATLTVKLKKDIALDSVTTGSTTMNTTGISNGNMSLTNTGMIIKNNDVSKQVSVTTSGVSMGSQRIQNVADAAQDTDAATLKQVKNARTVVAKGNNVKDVTPVESTDGTHQVTYTVNVDNLSVKANTETAKSVTLNNGLTFNNGTNTTASVGSNGEVKYDLNSTLTGLTSVTAGNSTLDTNGLTIKDGAATKVEITSGNVTMGGNVIHNVGAGQVGTDAVNKDQLDALQTQVNGGWNLAGNNAEGTAVTAKIGAGKTVTYGDGNYTKFVVTKDDSTGNATVKVDVTTGTFGSGTGDKDGTVTATANGLATTEAVANAINSAYWTIQDGNNPGNAQQVKAGDTVSLKAGDNLSLEQNGKEFTYKLNKTLKDMISVTAEDDKKNTAVLNSEGLKVSDKDGNSLTQHATEIRLHDGTKAAADTATDVVLNKQGLQNGGHTITGVADGTIGEKSQDAINGSQFYKLQQSVTNGGWNITGEDTNNSTHIGNDKTVSFKNGAKTTVEVTGSDTGAVVKVNVNTTAIDTDADHKATATGDGLATASDVASAINNAAWNVKKNGETAQQVKAGDTVTFDAGDNIVLNQSGTNFTYGLASDVNINSIRLGGTKDGKGNWAGGIYIGEQAGSGANLAKGFYITGLSNTKWDRATISENSSMAATEGQLKQAIENITKSGDGTGGFGLTADSGEAIMQDLRKTIQIKGDGEGTVDGNITTSNESGVLRIRLNKKLDLTDQGSVTIGSSSITNGQAKIGRVTVNGTDNTVSGLANTEWKTENVNVEASAGGYKGSTKAATESQLAEAISTATTMAAQNEQHIQAGNYEVGKGTGLDGKAIDKNSVAINVISGDGTKPGDIKGQVVINDVAKASDVGDTDNLADEIKKKNGDKYQKTSVVEAVNNLNEKVNTRVGDNKYSAIISKDAVQDGDNSTTAIAKLNNRMTDIYHNATQHSSVSVDGNLTLDDKGVNQSGGTDYKIGLNKENIDLGYVTIKGNAGSISAKSMTADSFTAGDTVVNNEGVKVGDKSALTADSLKVGDKTYVDSNGLNANGNAIHNVGEGKKDGDAVNVKQVNELAARQGEAITENAAHINQLGQAVNKLDNRINRVGAGAAALAALHPGDYDPDDKLDVSAGVGNYRGANAAAVGLFFHPNERTILSVAGSMGGGENMVNAGVTLKVGPGHGTPTTVTTKTGQKVDVMDILAKQTEILEKLAGNTKAASAPAGSDIFPDVPQNHWAYAYVDKLYRAGSLAGFSEPGKLKSHMLTRKDFAEILYWAMTNGATTNPELNGDGSLNRLAAEFGAELKLVVK